MEKLVFVNKLNSHCKHSVKVEFLLKSSKRENQYTVISYMAVWSEIVREADFFEKTCLGEMM